MQITLIVGNGFDKALDLPTGYYDFYQWWMKQTPCKNKYVNEMKEIIAKAIADKKNKDLWSDYEIALGQFVWNITSKDLAKHYSEWKNEADSALIEYLKSLHTSDDVRNKINSKRIIQTCVDFLEARTAEVKDKFFWKSLLGKIQLHLISLNYTDSLDQIAKGVSESLGKSAVWQVDAEVLHPHGTLKGEIVLGVNDAKQIRNNEVAETPAFYRHMIKNSLITDDDRCKKSYAAAVKAIKDSDMVCLFGLSLGDTDNNWWVLLGDWLKKAEKHYLRIYDYQPTSEREDYVRAKFLRHRHIEFFPYYKNNLFEHHEIKFHHPVYEFVSGSNYAVHGNERNKKRSILKKTVAVIVSAPKKFLKLILKCISFTGTKLVAGLKAFFRWLKNGIVNAVTKSVPGIKYIFNLFLVVSVLLALITAIGVLIYIFLPKILFGIYFILSVVSLSMLTSRVKIVILKLFLIACLILTSCVIAPILLGELYNLNKLWEFGIVSAIFAIVIIFAGAKKNDE